MADHLRRRLELMTGRRLVHPVAGLKLQHRLVLRYHLQEHHLLRYYRHLE